jgi:two-component system invasion response regulator UvrY
MNALIVEDEEIVRELLASVVEREFDFEGVVEASDGESAWALFNEQAFDFVILDLLLPKLDGLSLARRILEHRPDIRIMALSSECDDYTVREVNRSGIIGFVDKNEMTLEVLFAGINDISSGHAYYSANAQRIITHMWEDPEAYYKILSDREFQVVRAIVKGRCLVEVGITMGISAFTVRRHKYNAMKKLNLSDEVSLLRFALLKGIVKHKGGLDWTEVSHQKQ